MHSLVPSVLAALTLLGSATAQRLIASDVASRELVSIDVVTGLRTPIVQMPPAVGSAGGLAWDAGSSTMFVSSTSADTLFTVDVSTGALTPIGPYGDAAVVMQGIELDTSTGQLYGCSQHDGGLYTIDRTTGAAALVGLTGLSGSVNLAYEPGENVLYATSNHTDSLYTVDRATGGVTLVGPLSGATGPQGLACDPRSGVIYLVDHSTDQLYATDPRTGTAWAVGSTGVGNLLGLAFVPEGSGTIARVAHGCGPATIFAHGEMGIGGTVTVHVAATTGVPFVGFGVQPVGVPFCGCTVGHEWTLAFAGGTSNVVIPGSAALVGLPLFTQGLDLFGSGGCADPMLALTDTLVVTIG